MKEEWSEKEENETIDIDLKLLKIVEAKHRSVDLLVKDKLYLLLTDIQPELLVLCYREYIMKVSNERNIQYSTRMMVLYQVTKDKAKKKIVRSLRTTGKDIDQHWW